MRLTEFLDEAVIVTAGGVEILRYVYRPDTDPVESPKPHIHPLRTLTGDVVSGYRPSDHRWHHGLAMAAADVSGENLWGGPSFVREEGRYVDLGNNGSIRHDAFTAMAVDGTGLHLAEELTWLTSRGEEWVAETRVIEVPPIPADAGSWELRWTSTITGRRAEPVVFGSPTTNGRPMAGYSGLFWRGPRDMRGGAIIGPDGLGGEAMMGVRAAWLAFSAVHDEVDRASTLVFEPKAGDYHWFVRNQPYAVVNPAWAFHDEFALAAGESRTVACRIVIASGDWDADRIAEHLRTHPW